jgi:hypothetical protein
MADNIFDQIHAEQSSSKDGGGNVFDQIHAEQTAKDTSTSGALSLPGAQQAHNSSYSDLLKGEHPVRDVIYKGLDQMGQGVQDVVGGIPKAIAGGFHAALPTNDLPVPGGMGATEAAAALKRAYDLSKQGKFSEAAKNIPVIGGAYDYATSHPVMQTAGAATAMAGLGAAAEEGVAASGDYAATKLGTKAPKTTFGESPGVKPVLEALKPGNAKQAVQDYPVVMSRLVREHPELTQGRASLKEISDALDDSMQENRHYNEAFTGPVKDSGMKVSLSPIAQAIEDSITPLMEKNAPGQVRQLRALANKYRTKDSMGDLESMLRETNAQVSDLNKMNPGDRYNSTTANGARGMLDNVNKALRSTYNEGMEKFTGSPAVRALNFEYGKMMGFRQDLEGLVQDELVKPTPSQPGLIGKGLKAAGTLIHPMKSAAGAVVDAMKAPEVDNVGKLSQAFKEYKGPPAQDYPTPPQYAGPGGGAGSPGNIPQGTYPGARPVPAGAYPGATPGPAGNYTPNSALPSRGLALPAPAKPPLVTPPPADTSGPIPNAGPRPGAGLGQQVGERQLPAPKNPGRQHPGDTYGERGMGPAVTSERPPHWEGKKPEVHKTPQELDMVKVMTKDGPAWVKRSDLKGPGAPLPKRP